MSAMRKSEEYWALDHGIPVRELSDPPTIYALDGHILSKILHATAPVSLAISGNHQETISFFIICSPLSPIVLEHPWLTQLNLQFNWGEGTILSWGLSCHVKCLVLAMPVVSSVSVFQEEPGDLLGVPEEYCDLRAVFITAALTWSWVVRLLVVNFIPCTFPNVRRSKKCLTDSLATGTIVSSPSPAGAGFFFVKKKDGSLHPCIDYRGLNDMTIKNRYPLPLMSSAFEILQGAKFFTNWTSAMLTT